MVVSSRTFVHAGGPGLNAGHEKALCSNHNRKIHFIVFIGIRNHERNYSNENTKQTSR